jgi:CRP-like cAMP-binding protein
MSSTWPRLHHRHAFNAAVAAKSTITITTTMGALIHWTHPLLTHPHLRSSKVHFRSGSHHFMHPHPPTPTHAQVRRDRARHQSEKIKQVRARAAVQSSTTLHAADAQPPRATAAVTTPSTTSAGRVVTPAKYLASAMAKRPFERSTSEIDALSDWASRVDSLKGFPQGAREAVVASAWYEEYDQDGIMLPYDFVSDLVAIVVRGRLQVEHAKGSTGGRRGGVGGDTDAHQRHHVIVADEEVNEDDGDCGRDDDSTATTAPAQRQRPVAVIEQLGSFGTGCTPAVSVRTMGPAAVLMFSHSTLERANDRIVDQDVEARFSALVRVPALTLWTLPELRASSLLFRWATADPGDVVAREGRRATKFAIVVSGKCDVYRDVKTSRGVECGGPRSVVERVMVGTLRPGAFYGEMSVLGKLPCATRCARERVRSVASARGEDLPSRSHTSVGGGEATQPAAARNDTTKFSGTDGRADDDVRSTAAAAAAAAADDEHDDDDGGDDIFVEPVTVRVTEPTRLLIVDAIGARGELH